MRELNPLPLASDWHTRPLDQVLFVCLITIVARAVIWLGLGGARAVQEGAAACAASWAPPAGHHALSFIPYSSPKTKRASQGTIGPLGKRLLWRVFAACGRLIPSSNVPKILRIRSVVIKRTDTRHLPDKSSLMLKIVVQQMSPQSQVRKEFRG